MKKLTYNIGLPTIFFKNGKAMLIPSMVASTFIACTLITFLPQLMPLWMAWSTSN